MYSVVEVTYRRVRAGEKVFAREVFDTGHLATYDASEMPDDQLGIFIRGEVHPLHNQHWCQNSKLVLPYRDDYKVEDIEVMPGWFQFDGWPDDEIREEKIKYENLFVSLPKDWTAFDFRVTGTLINTTDDPIQLEIDQIGEDEVFAIYAEDLRAIAENLIDNPPPSDLDMEPSSVTFLTLWECNWVDTSSWEGPPESELELTLLGMIEPHLLRAALMAPVVQAQ